MFKRQIIKELNKWRNNTSHLPLVVRGARQVGKTTVINNFGMELQPVRCLRTWLT